MKFADAKKQVRNHPIVIGARLDGHDVWVCCQSGNITLQLSTAAFEAKVEAWDNGDDDAEQRPTRFQKSNHPTQGAECNGITCEHSLIMKVKRVRPLLLAKETLDDMQRQVRELDQNK